MMSSAPESSALAPWRLALAALVTLGNATCGFAAVLAICAACAHGAPTPRALAPAGWWILAGWLFDMADGTVARLLRAISPFGAQLDSLCDALSFGFAPALLVAALGGFAWLPCLAGLAYLWAALARLARFNAAPADDHLYFRGLPSVAAAAIPAAGVALAGPAVALLPVPAVIAPAIAAWLGAIAPGLAIVLAALMLSPWRYPDLPKHYARRLSPRWHLPVFAVLLALLGPAAFLLAYFALYALAGVRPARGARA